MINTRISALNVLLLGALLLPTLASCGGANVAPTPADQGSVLPTANSPVVTVPPVTAPTAPPVTTPPVTNPGTLPPVVVAVDRPSLQLVEKANVPPQTFILTINRTVDQVQAMHLSIPNVAGAGAPTLLSRTGVPEARNGVSSWYMEIDARDAVQGDYTYTLNVLDMPGNVIGTTTVSVKVTHDLRVEADLSTWSANEQQVFSLVNELRTRGSLNGNTAVVAGTCAAGLAPMNALLPSSVGYLAARGHANWFATYGYTAHIEADHSFPTYYGETMNDRMNRASNTLGTNVSWTDSGENVGAGQTSPLEIMNAWLHSSGHCHNMMNPAYTHMAAGYASAGAYRAQPTGNIYQDSWVQEFLKY